MRTTMPENFRVTVEFAMKRNIPHMYGSTAEAGRNGMFFVPHLREVLRCIASDGEGWEHVSVSLPGRCPTWEEMCFVKRLFWEPTEVVIEYHPAEEDYVNNHPFCLHLWKPSGVVIPTPPSYLVGIKGGSK